MMIKGLLLAAALGALIAVGGGISGGGGSGRITTSAPLTGNGTPSTPATCRTASGAQSGCLSSADWTTFNGKLAGTTPVPAATGGTGSIYGFAPFLRHGMAEINMQTDTVFTPYGLFTSTESINQSGAGGSDANNIQADRDYIKITTAALNTNYREKSFNNTNGAFQLRWAPVLSGYTLPDATISSMRAQWGLQSGGDNAATCSTSATADTQKFLGLCYDTGGSPGTTYLCCSSTGGGAASRQCTDTTVAVVASTKQAYTLDMTDGATLKCTVGSTTVTAPAGTMPSSSQGMSPNLHVTTLTNAARSWSWSAVHAAEN